MKLRAYNFPRKLRHEIAGISGLRELSRCYFTDRVLAFPRNGQEKEAHVITGRDFLRSERDDWQRFSNRRAAAVRRFFPPSIPGSRHRKQNRRQFCRSRKTSYIGETDSSVPMNGDKQQRKSKQTRISSRKSQKKSTLRNKCIKVVNKSGIYCQK